MEARPALSWVWHQIFVPVQVQARIHNPADPLEDLLLKICGENSQVSYWCPIPGRNNDYFFDAIICFITVLCHRVFSSEYINILKRCRGNNAFLSL